MNSHLANPSSQDDKDQIVLSIIITMIGGIEATRTCLSHLLPQIDMQWAEVLVPYAPWVNDIDSLCKAYPQVRFIEVAHLEQQGANSSPAGQHLVYDTYKAEGLKAARGSILALLDDQGSPAADWVERLLQDHELPYEVIGGAVEHRGHRALNWAVYLQDFGRYQLPLQDGPSPYLTDINLSYKRESLESVYHLWQERYNEVVVNWELARCGAILWLEPRMVVYQDRGSLRLGALLSERFTWGRLFGSIRVKHVSFLTRVTYGLLSPLIPLVLITRIARKAWRDQKSRSHLLAAMPFLVVLTAAWSVGEFVGNVTGKESHI